MTVPQTGIFALGNLAHTYLELDLRDPAAAPALVDAVADLSEPRTTMGGVNLVTGFRPELWRAVAPDRSPRDLHGFVEPVVGIEGFSMPATQHDLVLWVAGGSNDVVFDAALGISRPWLSWPAWPRRPLSWSYHRDLDLTGFIDGTENPSLLVAPSRCWCHRARPVPAESVLLLQKWVHDAAAWSALSREQQERVIGRTKQDSVELSDRPVTSHVARTDQERVRPHLPAEHAVRLGG